MMTYPSIVSEKVKEIIGSDFDNFITSITLGQSPDDFCDFFDDVVGDYEADFNCGVSSNDGCSKCKWQQHNAYAMYNGVIEIKKSIIKELYNQVKEYDLNNKLDKMGL